MATLQIKRWEWGLMDSSAGRCSDRVESHELGVTLQSLPLNKRKDFTPGCAVAAASATSVAD